MLLWRHNIAYIVLKAPLNFSNPANQPQSKRILWYVNGNWMIFHSFGNTWCHQCFDSMLDVINNLPRYMMNFYCVILLWSFQTGLFAAKPTGFGTPSTGLFGQPSGTGSTGFSFTQTQPQSTLGSSLFGAKTTASTGFGGFGATGTTGFSTMLISMLHGLHLLLCFLYENFILQQLINLLKQHHFCHLK